MTNALCLASFPLGQCIGGFAWPIPSKIQQGTVPAFVSVCSKAAADLCWIMVEYLLALAIPRRDTKVQAKALIARFGGIGPLLCADADNLKREGLSEGVVAALKIAEATALRLLETRVEGRPVLSSWDALGDYLQAAMAHSPVEEVRVLFLNLKNIFCKLRASAPVER